jgi:hypothetical protein
MEVCDRYSTKAMNERANSTILNDVSPKDVKQLEVLRPHSTPSMGQRYKLSLEKEKRLEAANKPIQKKTINGKNQRNTREETDNDDEKSKETKSKKKRKKNKRVETTFDGGVMAQGNIDQEDEVEEGINWSDDEE